MEPKLIIVICIAFLFTAGCTTQPSQPIITPGPSMLPPTTPAATTPQEPADECRIAEDCEPAECCHPTRCVKKGLRTPCNGVYCTMVCSGPLDCGAGNCGCVQGTCSVVPRSEPRYAPAVYTGVTIIASPPRYSPMMSSTPGIGLELTAIGFPPEDATFTWNASYGRFLSWNAPDYRVDELGDSTTNNGEKLYWSFTDKPVSTATPVTITVTATENSSGRILGSESVILAWDGNDVVVVKE